MAHYIAYCLLLLVILMSIETSYCETEAEILLSFKDSLFNASALSNWNVTVNPCTGDTQNWVGLKCAHGRVHDLQLENMGLSGLVDIDSLRKLKYLRALSLDNNSFGGPLPAVKKLGALKALFLSGNHFSGHISDDAFKNMGRLKKVYLNRNEFTGDIPTSLAALPRIIELNLEGNVFQGRIPEFQRKTFRVISFANNELEGPIPVNLSGQSPRSFAGNKGLCGRPLNPCKTRKKCPKKWAIITTVIVIFFVLGAIITTTLLLRRSRRSKAHAQDPEPKWAEEKETQKKQVDHEEFHWEAPRNSEHSSARKSNGQMDLFFVRQDKGCFDMHDLLSSSAEILGSGSFGSSYKAFVQDGSTVVVKRFKFMNNVGKKQFQEHMKRIGRFSHPNLLPLVAFYCCKKEEKLLIFDYIENGSLASHLHARSTKGQAGLDWPTRLMIIKGITRGLAYLHAQLPDLKLPHGHIKSSNILLTQNFTPLLTDYSLCPLINSSLAHQVMVAYKSPESSSSNYNAVSPKTDVWNLGILVLEILTGQFPANYLRNGKGGCEDLRVWVAEIGKEEWKGKVFDEEMKGVEGCEGEMEKLFRIGVECCEWEVGKRLELSEAIERIESLNVKDGGACEEEGIRGGAARFYGNTGISEEEFRLFVHNN